MDTATKSGIWIIAAGVIVAFLSLASDILTPIALAVFLFLVIEGFARQIDTMIGTLGRGAARLIAMILVLAGFILYIALMATGIARFSGQAAEYEAKIDGLISDAYGLVYLSDAPSLSELLLGQAGQRALAVLAEATTAISESLILVLIYLAFMFIAESTWPGKLDRIFPDPNARSQAKQVGDAARRSIETYLWTQTVISALITVLTWITLTVLDVQNALFLSALVFVLNYIPTIGSIIAAFVPLLFALVQPSVPDWAPGQAPVDGYIYAGIVFGAVSFWQFAIGNFIQPR
ncbi:MAG: AI-2E family transporter, partial [Pseudomonadota bacterium]